MKNPDLLSGNLPEIVWDHLKIIAAEEAANGRHPAAEQCLELVEGAVRKLIGERGAFPDQVVRFYAEELQLKITSLMTALSEETA